MRLVWQGHDLLLEKGLGDILLDPDDEAKEESINCLLCLCIDECKTGDEPFGVIHEPPEQTRRKGGRARSPHPDICFTLYAHPRTMWPMEGKLLHSDGDVSRYVGEIKDNFLTGRYGPFSSEAAMLGYLMAGTAKAAFGAISSQLGCPLTHHPSFPDRDHKLSGHKRRDLPQKDCPRRFLCHHLVMQLGGKVGSQ
ncbi:MAG: hypothetical protein ACYSWU_08275 [Planctomycetota bacterium]|jgi:hypothetical protein